MNLFETTATEEILSRLNAIHSNTPAQWGKMNAAQMMAHCTATFKNYFGELKIKQAFIGKLFGKMAKKKMFSTAPIGKGLPTDSQYKMSGEKDFEAEKESLIVYINRFATEGYTVTSSVHPFFGKMSAQEWAVLGYRHMDHHLKQFGV
ncbi:MAG: hypothetical protein JWR72_2194 [Flavisolibacter sp.]|jgi:hypothetical protein|nr:hypothetical protein [Flavisolibacter sp.]